MTIPEEERPIICSTNYGTIEQGIQPTDEKRSDEPATGDLESRSSSVPSVLGFIVSMIFVGALSMVAVNDKTIYTNTDVSLGEVGQKPNFIVIVADDLSWNSIGYTEPKYEVITPTLTSLARSGVIMDNFYAQEVCSPARASLLTGRYPLSIGMQYGMVAATAEWGMDLDEMTIAEILSDHGYATHMLGKWHLGHFSPRFLPTARGFDTYTGYLNGETHYWSKKEADYPAFVDLIESDRTCYRPYNHSDIEKYSTHFYTDKAVRIIDEHPPGVPLFMYLAYQAVHAPFSDMGKFKDGMPDSYIDNPDVLDHIKDSFDGLMKQEYAKSLYILDQSVNEIYNKLDEKDMLEHTYIIFMSDNGGCVHGGGTNGPLRGSKGSMFEGGIKVDSFIYHHSAFVNATRVFTDLFHISDWAPTMLSLANINYLPEPHHAFDGFSQKDAFFGEPSPRRHILYNMYLDLTESDFDIWHNGSFAVRDNRFKLIHTYDDATFGQWNDPFTAVDGDDDLENDERCAQQFLSGNFTYYLFDLLDDPYELNNIYESHDEEHAFAKQKLYDLLPSFLEKSRTKMKITWSRKAEIVWHSTAGYVVPWADAESLPNRDKSSFPMVCPDVPLENIVGDPTSRPKHKPA